MTLLSSGCCFRFNFLVSIYRLCNMEVDSLTLRAVQKSTKFRLCLWLRSPTVQEAMPSNEG